MKELFNKILRPTKKWYDFFILGAILSFIMTFVGQLFLTRQTIGEALVDLFTKITGSEGSAQFMYMYSTFIGIWIMFVLFCLPKRNHKILGGLKRGTFKNAMAGLLIGFGSNALCILFAALHKDIFLSYNKFSPLPFFAFLFVVMVQSGAEELADRTYLYQKLIMRYKSPIVAIAVNSLVFAAMHLANPGVTFLSIFNIFLFGVLASLFIYQYDGLWGAILMHTGWNFSQSIFFGLPNSGIVSEYSLFRLEAVSARDSFFYSVAFGIEGTLACMIVEIVIITVMIIIHKGKGEANDIWAEDCARLEAKEAE
ncbi:MAG: CPBP family intramembrane metalloprotease [Firmicutes bacterium]|nr:CPBP family intramembrane metalloprotease [Bacillota bacterium]